MRMCKALCAGVIGAVLGGVVFGLASIGKAAETEAVQPAREAASPRCVRVPGWCAAPGLRVNGTAVVK